MKLLLSDAPVLPQRGGPPLRHALLDGAELARQSRAPTLMTVRLDGCEHEWSTFPRLRRLGHEPDAAPPPWLPAADAAFYAQHARALIIITV